MPDQERGEVAREHRVWVYQAGNGVRWSYAGGALRATGWSTTPSLPPMPDQERGEVEQELRELKEAVIRVRDDCRRGMDGATGWEVRSAYHWVIEQLTEALKKTTEPHP